MNLMKEALSKRIGAEPKAEVESPAEESGEMKVEQTEMDKLGKLAELVKDMPEAAALVAEMQGDQKAEMGEESSEEPSDDETMTSGMSDYDKEDVMKREKPRSLFERAQKESLKKIERK